MKVGQLLDRVEKGILVWTILGLALVGCIQVFTRYVLNYSFTWYEECGRYLGVFITFLGAAAGVKNSSHFTMDLLVRRLRRPWQQLLRSFTSALSAAFFVLVVWYSWKIVDRMYGYGTTSPAMGMPMFIAYLPIPVFSLLMAARFCRLCLAAVSELREQDARGEER